MRKMGFCQVLLKCTEKQIVALYVAQQIQQGGIRPRELLNDLKRKQ